MDRNLIAAIAELERRAAPKRKAMEIFDSLFDVQKAVASCDSRKIAVLTSRRAGKSWVICSIMAIQCLLHPQSRCLYLALTRENIKRIAWEILQKLDKLHNLNITFNKVSLTAVFPNGSSIECGGAKGTMEETERYLGAAFSIVAIDEAGSFSFPLLKYLIDSILMPTLLDARPEGRLYLTGTPRTVMKGIFYDATTKDLPSWARFHWKTDENPHIATQYLEEIRELEAINPDIKNEPVFQRELLGQWALDETDLVYRFNPALNLINSLPEDSQTINTFSFIIGLDIGWHDDCAFVVGAYREDDPCFYVIDSFKKPNMLPDAIASVLEDYRNSYPNSIVIADTGGSGAKTITQELAYRYDIPVSAAEKTRKEDWVELINSDFIRKRISILSPACDPLIKELSELTWKEKPDGRRIENPALANHLADSLLYSYRYAYHYLQKEKKSAPEIGTKEYWEQEEERMFEKALERIENKGERRGKY